MTQYIADEAHFKEVIDRVPKVKRSLWMRSPIWSAMTEGHRSQQCGKGLSLEGVSTPGYG